MLGAGKIQKNSRYFFFYFFRCLIKKPTKITTSHKQMKEKSDDSTDKPAAHWFTHAPKDKASFDANYQVDKASFENPEIKDKNILSADYNIFFCASLPIELIGRETSIF